MPIKHIILIFAVLIKGFTGFTQVNEDRFINNNILSSLIQIPDSLASKPVHEFLFVKLTIDDNNLVNRINVYSDSGSYFRNFILKFEPDRWNQIFVKGKKLPGTVILPIFLIIVDSTTNLNRLTDPSYSELQNQFNQAVATQKYYVNDLALTSAPSIKFRELTRKRHSKPWYKPLP